MSKIIVLIEKDENGFGAFSENTEIGKELLGVSL